jgi:hypothetical protein
LFDLSFARSRVIETRSGRYRVAWIPLARSPLPGFRACAVQAVPAESHPTRAIRLVLYERLAPPPEDGGVPHAA